MENRQHQNQGEESTGDFRDQWMVRTSQQLLAGPYTKEQVCQLIREGQLGQQDEVCHANRYWIFLHEREEVLEQLGIEPPQKDVATDEDTQTETVTSTATDTDLVTPANGTRVELGEAPELAEIPDHMTENTAILTNRALREFQPKSAAKKQTSAAPTPKSAPVKLARPHTTTHANPVVVSRSARHVEKTLFVRGFVWVLFGVAGLLFYWVFQLLKT